MRKRRNPNNIITIIRLQSLKFIPIPVSSSTRFQFEKGKGKGRDGATPLRGEDASYFVEGFARDRGGFFHAIQDRQPSVRGFFSRRRNRTAFFEIPLARDNSRDSSRPLRNRYPRTRYWNRKRQVARNFFEYEPKNRRPVRGLISFPYFSGREEKFRYFSSNGRASRVTKRGGERERRMNETRPLSNRYSLDSNSIPV